MRSTVGLLIGFAAALGAALAVFFGPLWQSSLERGREIYARRDVIRSRLERSGGDLPVVAWLGDSTVLRGTSDVVPYPTLIRRNLHGGRRYQNLIVAMPAHDAYHHYSLMGAVLEHEPVVVFIVANLRLFGAPPETNFLDVASWIPPFELGRALWLPWHERGITIPRLLMAQVLRCERAEEIFFAAEGLRDLFQERVLSPEPRRAAPLDVDAHLLQTLHDYGARLSERHPVVRMLAAAVEMGTRRGARVIVIVPPIPMHRIERAGLDVTPEEQVAVLRRAVNAAGGELVPLYDLLGPDEFRDKLDHMTTPGATKMAEALTPLVRSSLPARKGDRRGPSAGRP